MNEQELDLMHHTLDGESLRENNELSFKENYQNLVDKQDRKLASIEIIEELKPIHNADNIEVACVKGWEVVVKKGEFKVADKIIYIEVDSILPDKPCFEFLRTRNFRIKTIKLKGQISQGICFPLNIIDDFKITFDWEQTPYSKYQVGQDVTELLEIKKYIKESTLNNVSAKGNFPSFANKTDEERFQNILPLIKQYENQDIIVREKLDGSSITVYYKDGQFGVCSRNLELKDVEGNKFWDTVKKYNLHETLPIYCQENNLNLVLQGELIGNGIQGNKYQLEDNQIYFFDVFNPDTREYYNYDLFLDFITSLKLNCVPYIMSTKLISNKETLISWSKRNSLLNPKVKAEGIVIRTEKEQKGLRGTSNGRFSFKVINPEWLLKYDE